MLPCPPRLRPPVQLAKQKGHKGASYADTEFCKALQTEVGLLLLLPHF